MLDSLPVIRGSKKTGACFGECSRGMLLENDIFGNDHPMVAVWEQSHAIVVMPAIQSACFARSVRKMIIPSGIHIAKLVS